MILLTIKNPRRPLAIFKRSIASVLGRAVVGYTDYCGTDGPSIVTTTGVLYEIADITFEELVRMVDNAK